MPAPPKRRSLGKTSATGSPGSVRSGGATSRSMARSMALAMDEDDLYGPQVGCHHAVCVALCSILLLRCRVLPVRLIDRAPSSRPRERSARNQRRLSSARTPVRTTCLRRSTLPHDQALAQCEAPPHATCSARQASSPGERMPEPRWKTVRGACSKVVWVVVVLLTIRRLLQSQVRTS